MSPTIFIQNIPSIDSLYVVDPPNPVTVPQAHAH